MTDGKKLKIVWAPGCFDNFDGTQEELDGLQAEIMSMIESGELFEKSRPLDIEQLMEEDPELAQQLMDSLDETAPQRILQ